MTKSLHIALADLKLDRAWIVYPGDVSYRMHERVEAISLKGIMKSLARAIQR